MAKPRLMSYFIKNYTHRSLHWRSHSTTSYCFYLYNVRSPSLLYQSKNYAFSTKCFIPIVVRAFSTSKSDGSSSTDSSALAVFSDADKEKLNILKYVKGKSGIYMWTNKLNGKKYVGSVKYNEYNVNKKKSVSRYKTTKHAEDKIVITRT